MSERILKFLLSELQLVRVTCAKVGCRGVIEVPTSQLHRVESARCPVCGFEFNSTGQAPRYFADLKAAIDAAVAAKDKFAIEFVIPDESFSGEIA